MLSCCLIELAATLLACGAAHALYRRCQLLQYCWPATWCACNTGHCFTLRACSCLPVAPHRLYETCRSRSLEGTAWKQVLGSTPACPLCKHLSDHHTTKRLCSKESEREVFESEFATSSCLEILPRCTTHQSRTWKLKQTSWPSASTVQCQTAIN